MPEPTLQPSAAPSCETLALFERAPGLDAAQRAAIAGAISAARQRIAGLLTLPPKHGGLPPLHFAADLFRKDPGAGREEIAARTLEYLSAEIAAQPGTCYADMVAATREAAVIQACAYLTPEQSGSLRAQMAYEACRLDDMAGSVVEGIVSSRGFVDWESLRAALDFPETCAERVLSELRFVAEQMIALLLARPLSGMASPVDYLARLVAAGDPDLDAAAAAYLKEQIDPKFEKPYAEILRDIEEKRMDSLGRGLGANERARLRQLFRQNALSIELPDRRWQALFEARLERMLTRPAPAVFGGDERLPWHRFCEGLLLNSAQEARAICIVRALQRDVQSCGADVDRALPMEAGAREEIRGLLRAAQLTRWEAFSERSLCSIDVDGLPRDTDLARNDV